MNATSFLQTMKKNYKLVWMWILTTIVVINCIVVNNRRSLLSAKSACEQDVGDWFDRQSQKRLHSSICARAGMPIERCNVHADRYKDAAEAFLVERFELCINKYGYSMNDLYKARCDCACPLSGYTNKELHG